MTTTCFLLTLTRRAHRFLRRFTFSAHGVCPAQPGGYYGHDASVPVEVGELVRDAQGFIVNLDWPRDDPRWPATCGCGYLFQLSDHWHCVQWEIYAGPDGTEYTTHPAAKQSEHITPAPAGAMWVADWVPPGDPWSGPDGRCLMLRLPDRTDWMIDGPSKSGGQWTRTGEPPRITASPSIASPGYHGWLRDGILSDDLEGRRYP